MVATVYHVTERNLAEEISEMMNDYEFVDAYDEWIESIIEANTEPPPLIFERSWKWIRPRQFGKVFSREVLDAYYERERKFRRDDCRKARLNRPTPRPLIFGIPCIRCGKSWVHQDSDRKRYALRPIKYLNRVAAAITRLGYTQINHGSFAKNDMGTESFITLAKHTFGNNHFWIVAFKINHLTEQE